MGQRSLASYEGRWLLLFSHAADFTPVCTSEFIALSRAQASFDALGCDLLGLSVDGLYSHLAWVRDIRDRFGVTIHFPIIEDPSMEIARGYGMLAPDATDSSTARAACVIDPQRIVRAITWYPMSVGRSVAEMLRLVAALQAVDRHGASTPEAWQPGDDMLEAAGTDVDRVLEIEPGDGESWYFRRRPA